MALKIGRAMAGIGAGARIGARMLKFVGKNGGKFKSLLNDGNGHYEIATAIATGSICAIIKRGKPQALPGDH